MDPQPHMGDRLTNRIQVPVLDLDKAGWVRAATALSVLLGFAWVVWKLVVVSLTAYSRGSAAPTASKSKKDE